MNVPILLSSEELLSLEPILAFQSQRAKLKMTLDRHLNKWNIFVKRVEEGYPYGIDDYKNDLSVRDLIQEILDACPQNIKNKLQEWINILDSRYTQATKKVQKPLWSLRPEEKSRWWWYRIPLKLDGDLKNYLENWQE